MTRGPYSMATRDMTAKQARDWWSSMGDREMMMARKRKGKPCDDLGPDISYSHITRGKTRWGREEFVYELEDDGCGWYNQAHAFRRFPA